MRTASLYNVKRDTHANSLAGSWRAFLERVCTYAPDVVILIARKMPRLVELLELDFGPNCLVLSDMAVPFCHGLIRGRRVAIVDDLVNVGSTLRRAEQAVAACGARESKCFALGRRIDSRGDGKGVDCFFEQPLDAAAYAALVVAVPEYLRKLNKPYDLEFPIIRCNLLPPVRSAAELLARLRASFGFAAVHELTPQPCEMGLARITLDMYGDCPGNYKVRLYMDPRDGVCNVVPFAIPADLSVKPVLRTELAQRVYRALELALLTAPKEASVWPDEPHYRSALFARSVDFAASAMDKLGDLMAVESEPFSLDDAAILFGPSIRDAMIAGRTEMPPENAFAQSRVEANEVGCVSPFWSRVVECSQLNFISRIRDALRGATDCVAIMAAALDVLAQVAGAADDDAYALDWPYTKAEVESNPYLRLRVGPTFADLVRLCEELGTRRSAPSGLPIKNVVSAALDYLIDAGAAVPTLAWYDGSCHRVYRKGESPDRDAAMQTLTYAWSSCGKAMSITRAAKVNAVLAFSSTLKEVVIPWTLERGNVATMQATSLDSSGVELVEYARNVGRLRTVEGADGGE